jgi:glutamate--cysteine ligase
MSLDRAPAAQRPLTTTDALEDYFRNAERPEGSHKIGLEHEKFLYPEGAAEAVAYEGPRGVGALLLSLERFGHTPFREGPGLPPIALERGVATISLEPGGQLELSGTPFVTAREAHDENLSHLREVNEAAKGLGLFPVAMGYRPFDRIAQMPWMPKSRYRVMRKTLGERGKLAHAMMLMTATGQVSLDWADEADCARKVTLTARASPYLVAMFANSPLVEGAPSGYLSYRSHVWTQVDPARCGYLPSMIDGTFSYRAYVEWALDAPLLFLRRDGEYLTPKVTFRQLLREGHGGQPARLSDWEDHLSTLFPEVRIKKVMEVRSADCVQANLTGALAALMRGLLYDRAALDEASSLLSQRSFSEHLALHALAQKEGLEGKVEGRPLSKVAAELVEISAKGLARLPGNDAPLLDPLRALVKEGRSPARRLLDLHGQGQGPGALLAAARLSP